MNSLPFLQSPSIWSFLAIVVITLAIVAIFLAIGLKIIEAIPMSPMTKGFAIIGTSLASILVASGVAYGFNHWDKTGNPEISNIEFVYHKSGLTDVKSYDYDKNYSQGILFGKIKIDQSSIKKNIKDLADDANLQEGDIVKAHTNANAGEPTLSIDSLKRYQPNGQYQTIK